MMTIKRISPGSAYRYYLRQVVVGDGQRKGRNKSLSDAQDEAGVPAGEWIGRALPALGVAGAVTEAQMRSLFGEGLHPEADRIAAELSAVGAGPAEVLRAVKLGYALRSKTGKGGSVVAWDCVFRPPASVTLLWAFGTGAVPGIIDRAHIVALTKTVEWLEGHALIVRSGAGSKVRKPARPGVVAARFRHFDSRDQKPLLHDHVVISVKVQREDGKWAHLHGRVLLENAVAAGALYNQLVLEEVCAALGLATRPRIATPGKRPVMEIAGVPDELIDWTSTRNEATMRRLGELVDAYRARTGREPGPRLRSRLMARAAQEERPPKKEIVPLPVLRARWRTEALALFGADVIDWLLELARRAASMIRARVRAVLNVSCAAVDVAKPVYVHHGVFRYRHLLAEARRHVAQTSLGERTEPDMAERIARQAVHTYCLDINQHGGDSKAPRVTDYTTYTGTWDPTPPGAAAVQVSRLTKEQRARIAGLQRQAELRQADLHRARVGDTVLQPAPPSARPRHSEPESPTRSLRPS
ncbi:MobF family relaxase [Streptomyces sp. NPDC005065]|uniref:MobF family relaxase n=1 Tax=Streptomyces sp. NPDC005065 TaxID=3154461 RepID=UPI0033B03362